MKKIIIVFSIVIIALVITSGCSKKKGCTDPISPSYNPDAEESDGSCEYAGLGGSATIVTFPEHHGMHIGSTATYHDSAFVKFNVTESPGSGAGAYDKIFVGEEGEDHVHLTGLKKGKYYIMVTCFDTIIHERVSGGIPYTLLQSSGEVDLHIPVTE